MKSQVLVAVTLALATVGSGVGLAFAHSSTTTTRLTVNPPVDPAWAADLHDRFGVRITQVTPPNAAISPAAAVQAAESAFPSFLSPADAPGVSVLYLHYGRVSDHDYYTLEKDGSRTFHIMDMPAWMVTFDHANIPLPEARGKAPSPVQDNEATAIVDATTGETLLLVNRAQR
jgi:hypothetical protein